MFNPKRKIAVCLFSFALAIMVALIPLFILSVFSVPPWLILCRYDAAIHERDHAVRLLGDVRVVRHHDYS